MKVGIGQDSHRFEIENKEKKLVLGGVTFDGHGLNGNSDADVVLHAITNAISGVTCKNILGEITDNMCKNGITDSKEYVKEALTIEGKTPKISPKVEEMRQSIAEILGITTSQVGITATTGEGLTEFGKGNGISVFAIITVS